MLENTIIAYSHDNGGVPYAGALNYPLRGGKATVYEGGCRSPGFIHAPMISDSSGHFTGLFHVSDYYPTLLSMVNKLSGDNTTDAVEDESLDGVDQVKALIDGTAARESVHIHRDFVVNTHVYRKGDWKMIVGHHAIPFIFPKVYEEPLDGWLIDQGSLRGKIVQMFLSLADLVIGQDNYLFLKYMAWFRTNAYLIGGWGNFPFRTRNETGVYQQPANTDFEKFKKMHTEINPKVSLFNLKSDPQETENLASQYPEMVKELLEEAEDAVKDAPAGIAGNMVEKSAPVGPQSGSWWEAVASLGAWHTQIIPFGPYLDDETDISKLEYRIGFLENFAILPTLILLIKVFSTFIFLALLPILIIKFMFRNR